MLGHHETNSAGIDGESESGHELSKLERAHEVKGHRSGSVWNASLCVVGLKLLYNIGYYALTTRSPASMLHNNT